MENPNREELRDELREAVRSLKARLLAVCGDNGGRRPAAEFAFRVQAIVPEPGVRAADPRPAGDNAAEHILGGTPDGYRAPGRTLDDVRRDLGDCRRCGLCTLRKSIVFGEGNPDAELVFVGEAPGADEDLQGRPFVGSAGQLLTRIIQAMGLKREDVYICNILKCRPPGNRNPMPDEIAACEPFLVEQIQVINPKMICALGTVAARTLLKTEVPITLLRGRFHTYHGVKLMPTYHPAYLLRNPGAKKQVWEDVQMIMKLL